MADYLVMRPRRPRPTGQPRKSAASPAAQLATFVAKFDSPMAARIRQCRRALRKRFPTANELVYDAYNFFVIGYSTTLRPSDTIVCLTANAKGVGLAFYYGADLPDPHGILEGSGTQNRFVRLKTAASLTEPALAAVIRAAAAHADPPLPKTGGGQLVIRAVYKNQRSRRESPPARQRAGRAG